MALLFLQNGNLVSGFWIAFMVVLLSRRLHSEPTQDKQALLSFLSQTPHANRLQWNTSDSACNWVGVQCNANRSGVYSLRLPAVGLLGPIPANTIGQLTQLRVLSLRSNGLSGQIPPDFSNLKSLRNLYLQNNHFSGAFPVSIIELSRLNRLDLSGNNFTGLIPVAVDNLAQLTGLFLENNGFTGKIPNINGSVNLLHFNVSNNHLNGSIPASLMKFPASAFAGNIGLCGEPLPPCSPFGPSPAPSPSSTPPPENPCGKKTKKLSTAALVAISVAATLFLLLLLLILFLRLQKSQHHRRMAAKPDQKPAATARSAAVAAETAEARTSSSKDEVTGGGGGGTSSSVDQGERNSLVFFEGGGVNGFDLEDLLRASAEVLGKGGGGTSYKAVLEEEEEDGGTTVVVKRLKDVVVSQKEFESQMEALGKIKHNNVLPLRAYYYSKDEKLLVYDFMPRGSLSALLHGSRGSGRTPLDWGVRLRVALGVARGLAHLHDSGKLVHGNIKSSNILLRQNYVACVADFGLTPLVASSAPPNRVAGYRAPEVIETRKTTFKSDVYSFGILLLELLTGKSPNQASLGEEGIDLPRWVQSVVREEWTAEVFDVELMRYEDIEEEMVQLLQIAMACVSTVPDRRPAMAEIERTIEEMNMVDKDYGSWPSSSKGSDGHTPPPEFRAPPRALVT